MHYGPDVVLDEPAYIDPTARLHGKVRIGRGASVWPYAVIRAECHEVEIGEHANVQDFVMVHVGLESGTRVGAHTTIAHHCTLHGCTIGDNVLVGIHATVADGAIVGDNSILAQHTLVREGQVIPPNSIVLGYPARVIATQNNFVKNRLNAFAYYKNALAYARGDHRAWSDPEFVEELRRLEKELEAQLPA